MENVKYRPVRISLIQTLPGKEFQVACSLREACLKAKINKYSLFKTLGGFDLIFIYEDIGYDKDYILEFDSNKYITNKSELYCYCEDKVTDLKGINSFDLAGLVRLKFDSITKNPIQTEQQLISKIKRIIGEEDCIIGSLTDLFFILPRVDFSEVCTFINELNNIIHSSGDMNNIKSFSYLSINYLAFLDHTFCDDEQHFPTKESFVLKFKSSLSKTIDTDLYPSLNIVSNTENIQEIKEYFLRYPYRVSSSLGYQDVVVRPKLITKIAHDITELVCHEDCIDFKDCINILKKIESRSSLLSEITWADFIYDLLHFRYYKGKLIHSTSTNITFNWQVGDRNHSIISGEETDEIHSHDTEEKYYDFDLLRDIFKERAISTAKYLYSFERLVRDPIFKYAYSDMLLFPLYMLVEASNRRKEVLEMEKYNLPGKTDQIKKIESEAAQFSRIACDALSSGCEIRSNGIHVNIEQKYSRFTKIKGGIIKALQAIEYIPTNLFQQASASPWYGFINIWEQSHIALLEEVICIPQRILWEPKDWWILWHECAHIFIDRDGKRNENCDGTSLISENEPSIRAFLSDKNIHDTWKQFLTEIAAEIIGYEFGFCQNFELFFRSYWRYFFSLRETGSHLRHVEPFIMRSFFVYLWSIYKDREIDACFDRLMQNDNDLHSEMLQHIEKIEKIINSKIYSKDRFIADSLTTIKELCPFIAHIDRSLNGLEKFSKERMAF